MNTTKEKSEFELIVDLLKNWLRHWYYFVIGIIFCGIIGGIYYKLKTPEYAIQAMVALRSEDSSGGISGFSLMKSLGFGKSSPGNNVEDEAIIMSSHGPVKKVVRELGLNKEYVLKEFGGIRKRSLYNTTPVSINYAENFTDSVAAIVEADVSVKGEAVTIKMKINDKKIGKFKFDKLPAKITTKFGDITFEKTPHFGNYEKSFSLYVLVLGDDLEAEIYSYKLGITEERKSSDIIHMKITDDNIARGKDVLNAVIRTHNELHAQEKSIVGEHTLEFVNKRLEEVSTELSEVDAEIQLFKEKYGLTDPEIDAKAYLDLGTELLPLMVDAQSQLEAVKLTDKYLSDPSRQYSPIPYVVLPSQGGNELMKAITLYNDELSKRNEMLQSQKKSTPVSKSFDNQLKALRENLVFALENTRKSVEISVNNLNKKDIELKDKMKDYPVMEKTFLKLKRTQELKQALYLFLQQKREESITSSVALNPKLRVIDEPYPVAKPVSPNLFKILLIVAFFGGVVLPLSAIALEPQIIASRKRRKQKKEDNNLVL